MSDVFDRLVGQSRAAELLRQYVRRPVHAFLVVGPDGSNLQDTVTAMAAALQCPRNGCGDCEACRLVLTGADTDVTVVERSGLSWRVDELREAERLSRRRPLGEGYQIVIIEDVELTVTGTAPSAPALLKTLEEPPPRTIFLLTAHETPPALDTIVSRCLEVHLRGLSDADVAAIVMADGVEASLAHTAAAAANGDVRRARILARDDALVQRATQWRTVPDRFDGSPAGAARIVEEIARALDDAVAPLIALQHDEATRRGIEARELGTRPANRRDLEATFKREQRRFRTDELRFGVRVLTEVYRQRLRDALDDEVDARSTERVRAALKAIDALGEANRRLATSLDESLLLHDLLLSLSSL